jgi:hypothetical protein
VTRAALRTRILESLNESATAPVFFSAAEINAVIDEAAEVLCEESRAIKRTVYVPLRPGSAYYSLRGLGAEIMAPWRIWLHSGNRRLTAVSMRELDDRHQTWPTVTGDPWHWFPVSWDQFGIWPRSSVGGGLLRLDCLAWPRALQDDDDEPELLLADHDAITLYGLYDGSAKRWDAMTVVQAWSLFMARTGKSVDRTGIGRMQSRDFQTGLAGTGGFASGVTGFDR